MPALKIFGRKWWVLLIFNASNAHRNSYDNKECMFKAGGERWPCFSLHFRDTLENDFVRILKTWRKEILLSASFFFAHSLTFTAIALFHYWTFLDTDVVIDTYNDSIYGNSSGNENQTTCHAHDVLFIRIYLIGINAIAALNLPLLLIMTYYSAQGSITDTWARRYVTPLLYLK